jgi:DNA polymerase-3 subunit epsilon
MFAVVDIETTGGYAAANGITEIAIVLHNGHEVEGKYETLVNPNMSIPRYVQSLTGITDSMVAGAPQFNTVAPHIYNLLKDRIFVAHNVNFDYSFVKHHLQVSGFELNVPKLCTIRTARKIFPGLPKYGLGHICQSLNINIENRHRAAGDAIATAQLLSLLINNDTSGDMAKMMKGRGGEQYLPPNVPVQQLQQLPAVPGVYYFHNKKGKPVYVGKARNLKQRVTSHFSNNKIGRQKQDFLKSIYSISYKVCTTELMAAILESVEIRRLWPAFNYSQKRFEQYYALYRYEDARGYIRLGIDKQRKNLQPLYTFGIMGQGHQLLKKLIDEFGLCPRLCFIDKTPGPSLADEQGLLPQEYNKRVGAAIHYLTEQLPSFVIMEAADTGGHSCILVEKGRFAGMGKLPAHIAVSTPADVMPHIELLPENTYIRNLVYQYAGKYPERTVAFS